MIRERKSTAAHFKIFRGSSKGREEGGDRDLSTEFWTSRISTAMLASVIAKTRKKNITNNV
jgi:hypothetical protein